MHAHACCGSGRSDLHCSSHFQARASTHTYSLFVCFLCNRADMCAVVCVPLSLCTGMYMRICTHTHTHTHTHTPYTHTHAHTQRHYTHTHTHRHHTHTHRHTTHLHPLTVRGGFYQRLVSFALLSTITNSHPGYFYNGCHDICRKRANRQKWENGAL